MVDSSGVRWRATLNQLNKDRQYLYKFKNRIWLKKGWKYNSRKLKCKTLLYTLKKFQI